MDKYKDNAFAEPMDAIILLNDNYEDKGLKKGYIGTIMDNFIEKYGFVVADFSDPVTAESIQPVIEIKKEDFRVISDSLSDRKSVKEFIREAIICQTPLEEKTNHEEGRGTQIRFSAHLHRARL